MKIKANTSLLIAALSYTLSTLIACSAATPGGTSTDSSELIPTDGSQNKSQLAGSYLACEVLASGGSSISGKAYTRYITLNSDGTYSMVNDLTGGTSCLNGHQSGGSSTEVYMQVNAGGTWAVGGTNTTPSTSTKIAFTQTSQTVTIYGATAGGSELAHWANQCSGWAGAYNLGATSGSASFFPTACTTYGNVSLGAPPAINVSSYNVGYKAAQLQTGAITNLFNMNAGYYPTSYTLTWY